MAYPSNCQSIDGSFRAKVDDIYVRSRHAYSIDPTMATQAVFTVEVDAFEGEAASISVTDADGAPLRAVYCVARRDEASGILRFVDYGYTSISEAREAWPEAQ